jgi:hypothetical protein
LSNANRREFLTAAASSALAAPALAVQTNSDKEMIGIQIGAVSFVDEGVEPVLDILLEPVPPYGATRKNSSCCHGSVSIL